MSDPERVVIYGTEESDLRIECAGVNHNRYIGGFLQDTQPCPDYEASARIMRTMRQAKREFIQDCGLTPEQANPEVRIVNTEPNMHGLSDDTQGVVNHEVVSSSIVVNRFTVWHDGGGISVGS